MLRKINLIYVLFFCLINPLFAQQITGQFTGLPNTRVVLKGFTNFETYVINSTQTDANGNFTLNFAAQDYGMALLEPQNNQAFMVVLANEAISLKGDHTGALNTIDITEGNANVAFMQYVSEQPKREQALSAWRYLQNRYAADAFYAAEQKVLNTITQEIERIHTNEQAFINNLAPNSYLRWYIPNRKLLGSVAQVAQYRPEDIPATRTALRQLDYADERLYKSGLLKEAIDNHIWFIENSSGSLDQVFADLNGSIDSILAQLKDDNNKFNLVASRLFEVLEERSLFTSSEYLSKKLLAGDDCGCLNPDLEKRLHKYGQMATGQTAPDIAFTPHTYFPEGVSAKQLSALDADYYLVVFAAGWCGHCTQAIPELAALYPNLKAKKVAVVLVSLDQTPEDFAQFAAELPFISTTDYQKWNSKAALDYQVYATPSYFMLDKDLKIVIKFNSVAHIKSWVDTFGETMQ